MGLSRQHRTPGLESPQGHAQRRPGRGLPAAFLARHGGVVVATDGPITERRRRTLPKLAEDGGFDACQLAFLSAFADRESADYRKTYRHLAWSSLAWFASGPDKQVLLRDGEIKLDRLLSLDADN